MFLDPPASELRRLIVENGGEWHTYFIPTQTTYKIATSLAISKWKTMTKHEIFLRPEWIVDSLVYLIYPFNFGSFFEISKNKVFIVKHKNTSKFKYLFLKRIKCNIFIQPIFSLNTNTLLPIDSYMLTPDYNPDQQSIETASTSTSVVESFYQRSRLHLISTLAQDLKKFVEKLKENRETHQFVSREKLNVLAVGDDNEELVFIIIC